MSIVFGPFASPGREHSEVLTHSSLRNCCCSLFLQATYWLNREGKEKAKDRRQKAEKKKEEKEGGEEKEEERKDSMNFLQRLLAREPINANCGNALCEEDSCQETGRKPPPHFTEATEQLLGDNSLHMLLTWSRSKLMANPHAQLSKALQVS